MKTTIAKITVGLLIAGSSFAADTTKDPAANTMPPLADKHSCTSCHAIDERVVGPAWRAVADKYRGDPAAAEKLQTKISKGGRGVWGTMPMPANDPAGTKQQDIKALVQYILSL